MRKMSDLVGTALLEVLKDRSTHLKEELADLKESVRASGWSNTAGFDRYNNALEFIFRTDTSFLDDDEDVIEFLKTKHPQSRKSM